MDERLHKVIALMDSPTEGEAAAAFRKARALLRQDGAGFRDLLAARNTVRADGPPRRDPEVDALRERVAELEHRLREADFHAASARSGLDVVERHLDGLDRKYKTALERKDHAIAKLRRRLAQEAARGRGPERGGGGAPRHAAVDPDQSPA